MERRSLVLAGAATLLAAPGLRAQDYPARPITMVVPYGPGGLDSQFRVIAQVAGRQLGQPIVVLNRPGANGTLGPVQVTRTAQPDGYTVSGQAATLLRQPHLVKGDWNPVTDFSWIIGLGAQSCAVAVREDSPIRNLRELVERARTRPDSLSYATPGTGGTLHLLMADLTRRAGVRCVHVPFNSGGEAVTALLGGHVDAGVYSVGSAIPQLQARKLRLLTVFDAERLPTFADVPTAREQGYDLAYVSRYGLVGPKGMPAPVVRQLHDAFKAGMEDASNLALLKTMGEVPSYMSTAQYTRWAAEAYEQERGFVESAGLLAR